MGVVSILMMMLSMLMWRTMRVSALSWSSSQQASRTLLTSTANERVKAMLQLKTKKKRDSLGLVVVEGYRHINDALQYGLVPSMVFQREEDSGSKQGKQLVEALQSTSHLNCLYEINDKVYTHLSDTMNGQGVIAAFHKPAVSIDQFHEAKTSTFPLYVLLDRISDPGNLGTIIRSAYGLGARGIIAVDSCDLWSPKVTRASMAMNLRMPVVEVEGEAPLDQLMSDILSHPKNKQQKQHFHLIVADGSEASHCTHSEVNYAQIMVQKQEAVLLLIGSEAHGPQPDLYHLPQHALCKQNTAVRIPMLRPVESFNAAMAASIILAEIARQVSSTSDKSHS